MRLWAFLHLYLVAKLSVEKMEVWKFCWEPSMVENFPSHFKCLVLVPFGHHKIFLICILYALSFSLTHSLNCEESFGFWHLNLFLSQVENSAVSSLSLLNKHRNTKTYIHTRWVLKGFAWSSSSDLWVEFLFPLTLLLSP